MTKRELTKAVKDYEKLQAQIKELNAQADELKQTMIAEMEEQGKDTVVVEMFTLRNKEQSRTSIDTKKFKANAPKLYDEIMNKYGKTTSFKKFTVSATSSAVEVNAGTTKEKAKA